MIAISDDDQGPIISMFWDSVPREFMRRILMCLRDAYPIAAFEAYRDHAAPEAENLQPFLRRAYIEEHIREIATPFGISATPRRGIKNWWNHTFVESGNVSFTESTVVHPAQVVRCSCEREQYSAENGQKLLFDELVKPENKSLYGIILHGRNGNDRAKLGFAVVRFPLPKVAGYYESQIDLIREFPGIVSDTPAKHSNTAPPEHIEDDLADIDLLPGEDIGG